ncbi:baseplate J/gp47 family protein [Muricauda sp. MAR_2010_75]|uniref:baseplate J/gp47 family protein n=1 Tax=Allomuricauda sp. MAR_2010_75 TaxID=1250232 RepID=UPI0005600A37|nr:baseplate J/gp47 family protein [Muricauda sp. MAR_2010_75]
MNSIPTINNIYSALEKDLKSKLNLDDDQLRKALSAMTSVFSAQLKLLYLHNEDVMRNLYPDTADTAENGGQLERLGRIRLNRNPRPATAGVYTVSLVGEENAVIRANLTFKANENSNAPSFLFVTDNETILTGSNDMIQIRSFEGGNASLLNVGDELTITEPVIGVEQVVVVESVDEQPKEAEPISDYRQTVLDAFQLEPQGGARTDYRLWAADVQGVRRVYPYVKNGDSGTVQVFVEAAEGDSTDGNGTPSQAILDEVAEVIEFDPDDTRPTNERGRRPIQAILEVLPIDLVPVDVTVTGLDTDTTAIRQSIESNLKIYLSTVRPFISGADLPQNQNDVLYAARLSAVVTDILDSGNFFTDFTLEVNGVAGTSFKFTGSNIPYLRNLIFD